MDPRARQTDREGPRQGIQESRSRLSATLLGEGEIDWKAVRKALLDVGYDGWITAEVGYGDLAALKDVVKRMGFAAGSG